MFTEQYYNLYAINKQILLYIKFPKKWHVYNTGSPDQNKYYESDVCSQSNLMISLRFILLINVNMFKEAIQHILPHILNTGIPHID